MSSLLTDLTTAVGPNTSVPLKGERTSATGCQAFRPSGVAPVRRPKGTLAEIEAVDGWKRPPIGPVPKRVFLYFSGSSRKMRNARLARVST